MPVPRLDITERNVLRDIKYLSDSWAKCTTLAPFYQYFISEMIMMRLFSVLNEAIEEIACKLVTNAVYKNGHRPTLLFTASNIMGAKSAMLSHGRKKARRYLNWTNANQIFHSARYVIDPSDIFFSKCMAHDPLIDEMRLVRNYIAHRNTSTLSGYRTVIRAVYGANSKISPGRFLVSDKRLSTPKLIQYLGSTKIVVSDLVAG